MNTNSIAFRSHWEHANANVKKSENSYWQTQNSLASKWHANDDRYSSLGWYCFSGGLSHFFTRKIFDGLSLLNRSYRTCWNLHCWEKITLITILKSLKEKAKCISVAKCTLCAVHYANSDSLNIKGKQLTDYLFIALWTLAAPKGCGVKFIVLKKILSSNENFSLPSNSWMNPQPLQIAANNWRHW